VSGAEARMVPESGGASCGMRGEVGAQPLLLRRPGAAAPSHPRAVAVESYHVPGPDVDL
jgi:hypothetical protein